MPYAMPITLSNLVPRREVSDGAIIIGQRVAVVVPVLCWHLSAAWHRDWRICDVGVPMIGLLRDAEEKIVNEYAPHRLGELDHD
jgi:hypothetical protein